MSVVDSLPTRPLSDATVSRLNRSEPVTLAVAVDTDAGGSDDDPTDETSDDTDDTRGLLVATDEWVRGLAFDDGWRVVHAVDYRAGDDGEGRYEALRECETAVRETL
ncbi:hypothetical protein [Halobaculum sp. MBLA0143]|uniref:hypothetical protein n=1 Tax=Halobaculum sp. MBLA0143 TaxID=3079933 RepID=UPI003523239E